MEPNSPPRGPRLMIWEQDLNSLDTDLDHLEQQNSQFITGKVLQYWWIFLTTTANDKIYLGAARVYAQSMYFFDPSESESRKQGILNAYQSAVKLLLLMLEADARSNFFLHISSYHLRMYLMATCILIKVLHSSYSTDVDFEVGKRLVNRVVMSASRCSVSYNESPGKFAGMVSQVWHSTNKAVLEKPPQLLVKSRLGSRYAICIHFELLLNFCVASFMTSFGLGSRNSALSQK